MRKSVRIYGIKVQYATRPFSGDSRRGAMQTSRMSQTTVVSDHPQGMVVCERCVVADRTLARMKALLGRADLPAGEGVLLRPAVSIHTHFMRFPIDAVFLDRNLRVMDLRGAIRPWRTARSAGAQAVLELRAGEAERRGIQLGDVLRLGPAQTAWHDATEDDVGDWSDPAVLVAPVIRLRPIRTLVIAQDLAYRRRSMAVLVKLGHVAFALSSLEDRAAVIALVERQRADVVVLDATACAGAIARTVAALRAAVPQVGVVVVSDHVDRVALSLPVLPKWGGGAELIRAVQDAQRDGNRGLPVRY